MQRCYFLAALVFYSSLALPPVPAPTHSSSNSIANTNTTVSSEIYSAASLKMEDEEFCSEGCIIVLSIFGGFVGTVLFILCISGLLIQRRKYRAWLDVPTQNAHLSSSNRQQFELPEYIANDKQWAVMSNFDAVWSNYSFKLDFKPNGTISGHPVGHEHYPIRGRFSDSLVCFTREMSYKDRIEYRGVLMPIDFQQYVEESIRFEARPKNGEFVDYNKDIINWLDARESLESITKLPRGVCNTVVDLWCGKVVVAIVGTWYRRNHLFSTQGSFRMWGLQSNSHSIGLISSSDSSSKHRNGGTSAPGTGSSFPGERQPLLVGS